MQPSAYVDAAKHVQDDESFWFDTKTGRSMVIVLRFTCANLTKLKWILLAMMIWDIVSKNLFVAKKNVWCSNRTRSEGGAAQHWSQTFMATKVNLMKR